MPLPQYEYDGKSIKTAAGFSDMFYGFVNDVGELIASQVVAGLSSLMAFIKVPWLNRAVDIRASRVSEMPYTLMKGEQDVTDSAEYASFMEELRGNLYLVELSKLLTGAGYLYLDANANGRNITFRFLRKQYVTPIAPLGKLIHFQFSGNDTTVPRIIPLDRIVYFWNPNLLSECAPGVGQAEVALTEASVLYALSAYVAAFFNGGGVKVTLFQVPLQMPKDEKDKFQNFVNRAFSGLRSAFKNIVVRQGITPTVIGSDIKDTSAPELVADARKSVSVAIGVPPPIIDGEHQNKATADAVLLAFYNDTVIPEFNRLAAELNKQFLSKYGLKLVANPELLEVMQDAKLTQAQAVQTLVGGKAVLTVNEAREIIGYEPLPEEEAPPAIPAPANAPIPPDDLMPEGDMDMEEDDASAQFETLVKSLASWRRAALANVGQPVGAWFDAELTQCANKSDVRAVFGRHWPRKAKEPTGAEVLAELRAAREVAERLTA